MTVEKGAAPAAKTVRREKVGRLRTKNVTALLLTAAMLFALVKASGGIRQACGKMLVASALFGIPQGAPALLWQNGQEPAESENEAGEEISEETEPQESSMAEDNSKVSRDAPEKKNGVQESLPQEQQSGESSGQESVTEEAELPAIAPGNAGTVVAKKYTATDGGIYIAHGAGIIKNCTSLSRGKIFEELSREFTAEPFETEGDKPLVLIVHTHATESYERYNNGQYDRSYSFRSTDNSENMVAVGAVLAQTLRENGIPTVQAEVQHDNPSYNGSYERSAATVKKYLELYPSIRFVLDIHRDAIEPQKGRIIKAAAEIGGKTAAQVMIISGCDDGTMNMPDYFENLRFAAALQDRMETLFPGLTRPVFFCYRKYNMDLSPGALLIEVGSHGNTLDEAKYSAELIGTALAQLLSEQNKTAGTASFGVGSGGGVRELALSSEQARKRFDYCG